MCKIVSLLSLHNTPPHQVGLWIYYKISLLFTILLSLSSNTPCHHPPPTPSVRSLRGDPSAVDSCTDVSLEPFPQDPTPRFRSFSDNTTSSSLFFASAPGPPSLPPSLGSLLRPRSRVSRDDLLSDKVHCPSVTSKTHPDTAPNPISNFPVNPKTHVLPTPPLSPQP